MKLIDKAALVAEIERRISVLKANESVISMLAGGMFVNEFKDLLSFLNTLEVKEVDLEKEVASQYESNYEEYLTYEEFADIAKHFFELGMQLSQ